MGPEAGISPLVLLGVALVPPSCSLDTNFPTSTSGQGSNLLSGASLLGDFLPGSASAFLCMGGLRCCSSLGGSRLLMKEPLGV